MVLTAHYDASYLNVSKAWSNTGAHIILSKNYPILVYKGPILKITSIIKCAMSSAADLELAALYICATEIVTLQNALKKWAGHKRGPSSNGTTPLPSESPRIQSSLERQSLSIGISPL